MKINEIFYSIQGEGPQVGMPTWFIRTTGCNLRCSWCDSAYALEEGKEMSIESIIDSIPASVCNNVVITGGEPLLQKDLLTLMKKLGCFNIYVETNGTIYDSKLTGFAHFIVSPKLQFLNKEYEDNIKKWKHMATFKFVVGDKKEFDEAIAFCKKLKLDSMQLIEPVYFMPKGTTEKELKERMKSIKEWLFEEQISFVRISPRLHISLWGNKRGV